MRAIFSSRDLKSLADIKGMKLRINPTPVYRDFYQLLGAAPTPIPTPQVFYAMPNGQVDGLEADLEFSWNQRFDKVSKVILQMNALFMPFAAVVSGRVWQTFSASDRDLITKTVKEVLDIQMDGIVSTEPGLVESFRKAPIPIRQVAVNDTDAVIAAFDKIWLPQSPVIANLRKIGASI